MIYELYNVVKPYAWGSRSALAELRGAPAPSPEPEAELWMGAHPLGPSRLAATGQSLRELIATHAEQHLGSPVSQAFGAQLPFLMKVLAAESPLSLQAHPSAAQAAAGFAADEAAGLPLDAPERSYKDPNHKPELLCALGEFWALCGFRDVERTLGLLDELAAPELAFLRGELARSPHAGGLRSVVSGLLQAPQERRRALALATAAACRARHGAAGRFADEFGWIERLARWYPEDVGLVSALLLNLVRLAPAEAIYLPAGNLHAYLGGTGVEIMASSDNVLRGGLTSKHVDVRELLRVLDFEPLNVEPLRPVRVGREHVYPVPAREFRLSYFDLERAAQAVELDIGGPEIWLVVSGDAELRTSDGCRVRLEGGGSAFVPASARRLEVSGAGRIFRAKVA